MRVDQDTGKGSSARQCPPAVLGGNELGHEASGWHNQEELSEPEPAKIRRHSCR